jgi:hypothetical protein
VQAGSNDATGGAPASAKSAVAEYYRVKADLCQQMAATATDPELRDQWIQLANQWTYLVLHVDQRGDGGGREQSAG